MKKVYPILILIFILTACSSGLRTEYRGRYYHTAVAPDFSARNISKIAIFVFSNGEPRDITLKYSRFYSDSIVRQIELNQPREENQINPANYDYKQKQAFGSIQAGLEPLDFSDEVTDDLVLYPDFSASQASFELASRIKSHLDSLGYATSIVESLGHAGIISAGSCVDYARDNGFDAAFIAYYSPIKKWARYIGYNERDSTNNAIVQERQVKIYKGFLYLPNASMFDTRQKDILWHSSYYGIIENAHLENISGQPFIKIVFDALAGQGGESCAEASEKAAKMLFDPQYWKKSFNRIPGKISG